MSRPVVVLLVCLTAVLSSWRPADAEDPAPGTDAMFRAEYVLKTPRSRDPVLGGPRDKVVVTVWIPADTKTVRGGMCNPFSKGEAPSRHWQAACRHWGFAYVQVDFDAVKKDEYGLLAQGLTDLAATSGHPELARMPLCFLGMSRGGGMSAQLAELMPERTLAAVPVCLEVGPTTEAGRHVPMLTVFGEKDGQQPQRLADKLPAARAQGARWGIAVQWGRGHEFALANNASFVFLDDVIARRLPTKAGADGAAELADVTLEEGWLGDCAGWGKDGRVAPIAAWKDFAGDRGDACWFPTQRSAAVWQAFVSGTKQVTIAAPPGLGDKQPFVLHSARQPVAVELRLDPQLAPAAVELRDAHAKLVEKSAPPWTFEVSLPVGIHSLIAVVRDAQGTIRLSRPHTVVVAE